MAHIKTTIGLFLVIAILGAVLFVREWYKPLNVAIRSLPESTVSQCHIMAPALRESRAKEIEDEANSGKLKGKFADQTRRGNTLEAAEEACLIRAATRLHPELTAVAL